MNHLYRIFFVFLGLLSYSVQANVRTIKSLKEFETYVVKPNRGAVVHISIDDIEPPNEGEYRTDFSGALPQFNELSRQCAGVGFFSVNVNSTPDVFIWLSQKGGHIGEWPAFVFIKNGEIQAVETKMHGSSLEENIRAKIKEHFGMATAPATSVAPKRKMDTQPEQAKSRKRRRNGRSRARSN